MQQKPTTASSPNKNRSVIILVVLLVAASAIYFVWKNQEAGSEKLDLAAAAKQAEPVSTAVTANLEEIIKKLEGRWRRTDGGYIIALKSPTPDGKIVAEYFNPNPIRVGSSGWHAEGDKIIVKVELQDVNYPGSLYTLEYFPKEDVMAGIYYQAVQKVNFDVRFERLK